MSGRRDRRLASPLWAKSRHRAPCCERFHAPTDEVIE
jgi:hypothetical protein